MASPQADSPKKPMLVLLVAAGLLVGARAVQLAISDWSAAGVAVQSADSIPASAAPSISQTADSPDIKPESATPLTADPELKAILAAACPHALELFEQDIHNPRKESQPHRPTTNQAPLRVAMLPTVNPQPSPRLAQRPDAWLVPPDNWFVPEDIAKEESGEGQGGGSANGEEPSVEQDMTPAPLEEPQPGELQPEDQPEQQPEEAPAAPAERKQGPSPASPDPIVLVREEPASPSETQSPIEIPVPTGVEPSPAKKLPMPEEDPSPASVSDSDGPELLPLRPAPAKPQSPPPSKLPPDNTVEEQPIEAEEIAKPNAPVEPASPPLFPAPEIIAPAAPTSPAPTVKQPSLHDLFKPAPRMSPGVSPHSSSAVKADSPKGPSSNKEEESSDKKSSVQAHAELFAKNCYPSARECGECHKKVYDEWKISSHAYAFVSPMFQKFEQKITDLSQGTVGYFCYRCHSPVGTSMGMNRVTPQWEIPQVAREGVTCIACHRINERYTKSNGERRVVPGDIHSPVYGGIGGDGVAEAISRKDHYKVKTSPDQKGAGQAIHLEGRYFDQLNKAEFCTSCHQVTVHPGIKLEVVWEQYRQSPACKKGVTCQDCHMGLKPGEPSGYEMCSIAEVGGKSVNERRKHSNHIFYGPNYSISHPGVFPSNKDADRWKMQDWLRFNWRSGWGTDDFEDAVDDGKLVVNFPEAWKEADDRFDAREVIEDNLKALERKNEIREEVMSHSLHITGPFFKKRPERNKTLRLYYDVTNVNEGHNVLTASLGAQPQLWANVALIGPNGKRLWESGYTDSQGDVCDIHSRDVRLGRRQFDSQLFNLQTMFLITGATGTDREMPLPVNVDIDQLPFLRPGALPISTTNHPPFIRMESRSIAPLGTKRVHYKIPAKLMTHPGKYRLSFRMRNRIEPIWFMRFCDATDEMVRAMNEGILDVHPRSVEFWVR